MVKLFLFFMCSAEWSCVLMFFWKRVCICGFLVWVTAGESKSVVRVFFDICTFFFSRFVNSSTCVWRSNVWIIVIVYLMFCASCFVFFEVFVVFLIVFVRRNVFLMII